MQKPSRQLLRHFTGRLTQAELLELRPEFAIANSGQDKGMLVNGIDIRPNIRARGDTGPEVTLYTTY